VLGYLKARLHRRLFLVFGLAIFMTAGVAGTIFWAFGESGWSHQVEGAERFVGRQFERSWDDPAQVEALARDLSADLGLGVHVYDDEGTLLHEFGPAACRHEHDIAVVRDRQTLGTVSICIPHAAFGPPTGALALAAAAAMLWMLSGFVSIKLTRPLAQLVTVTRDIGEGRLDSRMKLGRVGTGEMQLLAEAVNDMAARIEKQLGDQRELLASVSHEIRTPLGHLRVLLEMLRNAQADPKLVKELEREVMTIDAMVGQLLASSRVEFGTVDARELDATELAIRAIERADLDPTLLEVETEDTRFEGDAALVLQALANLLRNAQEHGGGAKALIVRRDTNRLVFEVRDGGPGFEDDELEAAFTSFSQGRDHQGGSLGLGLSLVRRIALAHGGDAWARNAKPGAAVGFSVEA
jgi:signal transduction histidine kinase